VETNGPASVRRCTTSSRTRERDVVDLIISGASNAEIALRLHLAEVTVKTYVGRIFAKLGVHDRVNIVIWAYQNGAAG
jgi:DNA-binding NarL/FixJ family response regulator